MDKLTRFFHSFNRTSYGLESIKGGSHMIRWRFSDAVFVAILVVLYPLAYRLQPFQRQFYINDLTISHPFAETERVSNNQLFLYAAGIPLGVIAALSLLITKPKHKFYVTYVSLMGVCIAVLSASVVTDVLKNSFGRHRPDFLARCVPRPDAPTDVMVVAADVCTLQNTALLMDGFRTTPLGHSSISFAGLLYLLLWLLGQLTVVRPQAGAWRWAVAFLPTLGAVMIALSRTEDYRHHFVDVFVGLCLGAAIAVWLYFRLFPAISAFHCYQPRLVVEQAALEEYLPVEDDV